MRKVNTCGWCGISAKLSACISIHRIFRMSLVDIAVIAGTDRKTDTLVAKNMLYDWFTICFSGSVMRCQCNRINTNNDWNSYFFLQTFWGGCRPVEPDKVLLHYSAIALWKQTATNNFSNRRFNPMASFWSFLMASVTLLILLLSRVSPTEYNVFRPMKDALGGQRFNFQDEVQQTVQMQLHENLKNPEEETQKFIYR